MGQSFNFNFYITAATVVPLFYITLFLQADTIQNIAKLTGKGYRKNMRAMIGYPEETEGAQVKPRNSKPIRTFLIRYVIAMPIAVAMYAVIAATLAGVASEGISIWALFYQSDNLIMREIVLWSMLGLLAAISIRPTITIFRNLFAP